MKKKKKQKNSKEEYELYADVLDDDPEFGAPKEVERKFDKRLHKSIGWLYPGFREWTSKDSSEVRVERFWDVETGGGCTEFKEEDEHLARVYSEVIQINHRLKRLEKKFDEMVDIWKKMKRMKI